MGFAAAPTTSSRVPRVRARALAGAARARPGSSCDPAPAASRALGDIFPAMTEKMSPKAATC